MDQNSKRFLVCGGAGFIGSSFVEMLVKRGNSVVVVDILTYAGHLPNIEHLFKSPNVEFVKGDIQDAELIFELLQSHHIDFLVNFAAESHVDNSISGPLPFMMTNIIGVFHLLESARKYWSGLGGNKKRDFRFLQVSTDEVYGELGNEGYFKEDTPYDPSSPYSASKASADHLVRAWHRTYGLPVILTNCSNNYGPRQYPEKLIPRNLLSALNEDVIRVYGKGQNVRDWIYVDDHCRGILMALENGNLGQSYCFGGRSERKNIDVMHAMCKILDRKVPRSNGKSYSELITFVEDRLGHDFRYAIDDHKAEEELGFTRSISTFENGLEQTIDWYLANEAWVKSVKEKTR